MNPRTPLMSWQPPFVALRAQNLEKTGWHAIFFQKVGRRVRAEPWIEWVNGAKSLIVYRNVITGLWCFSTFSAFFTQLVLFLPQVHFLATRRATLSIYLFFKEKERERWGLKQKSTSTGWEKGFADHPRVHFAIHGFSVDGFTEFNSINQGFELMSKTIHRLMLCFPPTPPWRGLR